MFNCVKKCHRPLCFFFSLLMNPSQQFDILMSTIIDIICPLGSQCICIIIHDTSTIQHICQYHVYNENLLDTPRELIIDFISPSKLNARTKDTKQKCLSCNIQSRPGICEAVPGIDAHASHHRRHTVGELEGT